MKTKKPKNRPTEQLNNRTTDKPLVDSFNRMVTYLRVSVTDRCNLDCTYCLPSDLPSLKSSEILSYEEIVRLVKAGVSLGVRKVRLTGGEPLVRSGVDELVRQLAELEGLEEIALTTNGILLSEFAAPLRAAGLRRINVSLDTLKPDRFGEICKRGSLEEVIGGIREAKRAGLEPVRVNVVVMRGVNDDELADFVLFGREEGVTVRLIEFMPARKNDGWRERYVSRDEMLLRLAELLDPDRMAEVAPTPEPARYYPLRAGAGEVGIISPVSHDFCSLCNRMRLTPDGHLLGCLMSAGRVDVKTPLRAGADDEALRGLFRESLRQKGRKGDVLGGRPSMREIGG